MKSIIIVFVLISSLLPLLKDRPDDWAHSLAITFVDHHAPGTPQRYYIRYASGEEELCWHPDDEHKWNSLAVTEWPNPNIQQTLKNPGRQPDQLIK